MQRRTVALVLLGLCSVVLSGPVENAAAAGQESRVGIDYVFPFMSEYRDERYPATFAKTGAGWVNFASVDWKAIEPKAPSRGRHAYDWDDLDTAVRVWQKHGFRIAMSLTLKASWYSGPASYTPPDGIPGGKLVTKKADRLPAPEHIASYRDWIRALVERYDADGKDDMPQLRQPILHYQVGNEYSNPMFWVGSVEDLGTLLKETRAAARQASPDVKIISNGVRWNDLFHGDPTAANFEKAFGRFLAGLPSEGWRQAWQRHRVVTEATVALADVYDILDAGGNGPYPGMSAGYMAWLRGELAKRRLNTTIWDMESRSEPYLLREPLARFHAELQVPGGESMISMLKSPRHRQHKEASEWYRAEQARILVRVFVTRFAAGFEKVFMGMPNDWDKGLASLITPNPFVGLLDSSGKNAWPAFHALKVVVSEIDGFDRAERVAADKDVELYRFRFSDGRRDVWVAWLAEQRPRGLDAPLPHRETLLKGVKAAKVTLTPTKGDAAESVKWQQTADGLHVVLSLTPVFIRE